MTSSTTPTPRPLTDRLRSRRVVAALVAGGVVAAGAVALPTLGSNDSGSVADAETTTTTVEAATTTTTTPLTPEQEWAARYESLDAAERVAFRLYIMTPEERAAFSFYVATPEQLEAFESFVNPPPPPPPPAAKPKAQSTSAGSGSSSGTSYSSGGSAPNGYLSCVVNRESRGNYGAVNSSSGAGGAYQFMPSTWNNTAAHAGRSDLIGVHPSQASPADQDAMAAALYQWQGASPWAGPGC
ncbi:MAG: transglycosylase family protein [Acidimicrobiales bacterium]|jgi:hypothetical protein|nr:transglycosylase family protein [Acidimicrobiales bacterium]